jgi:osmoprotectant transport system permease protein
VYEALRSGQIDVYAEYTGTIAQEIVKDPSHTSLADLQLALAPLGLDVGVPLGFNDGYALAMRRAQAEQLGIRTLSDLARHPELRFGLSNEFLGRADGWQGLAARYQLRARPTGLDHGLAYGVLAQGQIDVMDIYTTDAKIDALGLLVLEDDRQYFPRYDAVLLFRKDFHRQQPDAWAALQTLQGRISEAQMVRMNAQAELQSLPFDVIARQFLAGAQAPQGAAAAAGGTEKAAVSGEEGEGRLPAAPRRLQCPAQHPRPAAAVLAAPVGGRSVDPDRPASAAGAAFGWGGGPDCGACRCAAVSACPAAGAGPGTVGRGADHPVAGAAGRADRPAGVIGRVPALLALTAYSILPILSNTCAGLAEVSPGLRLAGSALGMTPAQRMRWVELPIALPMVVAGLRTACAIAIGTATIAAFIGAGGLGERIVTGLALNDSALMLAGAVPAAVLALASELLFELQQRWFRRGRREK